MGGKTLTRHFTNRTIITNQNRQRWQTRATDKHSRPISYRTEGVWRFLQPLRAALTLKPAEYEAFSSEKERNTWRYLIYHINMIQNKYAHVIASITFFVSHAKPLSHKNTAIAKIWL
jgi:hypothetical protein